MKNIYKIKVGFNDIKFILAIGDDSYSKYMKKKFGMEKTIEFVGQCTKMDFHGDLKYLIIAIPDIHVDVRSVKATLVHEITHAVTWVMDEYNFTDTELRSSLTQWLYFEVMLVYDKHVRKLKGEK